LKKTDGVKTLHEEIKKSTTAVNEVFLVINTERLIDPCNWWMTKNLSTSIFDIVFLLL
jgi:hypothetical protein